MDTIEILTESNALFTYSERCKKAAQLFVKAMQEPHTLTQEQVAKIVADSYQVEIVDMLAETNNQ